MGGGVYTEKDENKDMSKNIENDEGIFLEIIYLLDIPFFSVWGSVIRQESRG